MKRIIEGKTYNTETAAELCRLACAAEFVTDFAWHDSRLYQTRKGAFFVAGEGGAMSRWATPCGQNSWGGGEGVQPIGEAEAREILESEGETNTVERIFGTALEAAGEVGYTLRMPPHTKAEAAERAKAAGLSLNAYIVRCVEQAAG